MAASTEGRKMADKVKNTILENLAADPSESPLKIVLATVALGMGADLRHVRRVVNIGPPKHIEAYVQQMGRAGRDGNPSNSVLYYNSADIGRPEVSTTMRDYCKNETTCRREYINNVFGYPNSASVSTCSKATCCDICNPTLCEEYIFTTSTQEKDTLRVALMELLNCSSISHEQLNVSNIQKITSSYERFTDAHSLVTECNLDHETAMIVSSIINGIAEIQIN